MVTKGLACICLQALHSSSSLSLHTDCAENISPEGMKDAQIFSLHIVNLLALFCIFVLVSLILLLYFVINIFKINYTCCNGNGETVSTNWFARWLQHDSPSSSPSTPLPPPPHLLLLSLSSSRSTNMCCMPGRSSAPSSISQEKIHYNLKHQVNPGF